MTDQQLIAIVLEHFGHTPICRDRFEEDCVWVVDEAVKRYQDEKVA